MKKQVVVIIVGSLRFRNGASADFQEEHLHLERAVLHPQWRIPTAVGQCALRKDRQRLRFQSRLEMDSHVKDKGHA